MLSVGWFFEYYYIEFEEFFVDEILKLSLLVSYCFVVEPDSAFKLIVSIPCKLPFLYTLNQVTYKVQLKQNMTNKGHCHVGISLEAHTKKEFTGRFGVSILMYFIWKSWRLFKELLLELLQTHQLTLRHKKISWICLKHSVIWLCHETADRFL